MNPCRWLCCWIAALVGTAGGTALDPTSAAAQAGLGKDALPGLVSVPSASETSLVAGAVSTGYGYTGEVLDLGDVHHRIGVEGAASVAPLPQLIVAGRLGGRIDTHNGDDDGDTAGFATSGALTVRGRYEVANQVHVGLEASAIIPAAEDAKRSLKSLTPEFNGMATYQTDQYLVTGAFGARINRSDLTFPASATLSPYQVLALGATGDPQLLVGVGGGLAAGPVWCLVDFQFEPYLGGGAPAAKFAPALLGVGIRGDVRAWLQLGLDMQLSVTPYPDRADVPNTPVPPRISALGYVALRWDKPEPEPEVEPEPAPLAPTEPEAPKTTSLTGEVTGLHGRAIPDAVVQVVVRHGEERHTLELQGGATEFAFADLSIGDWELRVEAEGYEPSSRTVRLPNNRPLQIRLDRALPPGHIEVRVQDFRGRQVDARVVVLPERTPFQPTSETGLYNLDLAPGEYEIEIVSEGYAPETRTAVVAQNGVTIVVVDLRRAQEAP